MRILIIGSNSTLYQKVHRGLLVNLNDKIQLELIEVTRGYVFSENDTSDYHLVLSYLSPKDNRLIPVIFNNLCKFRCPVYQISSTSVNCIDHRFKYVQTKIAIEALSSMYNINILRCGSALTFKRNISEFIYRDDKDLFHEFLIRVHRNQSKSIENIYKKILNQRPLYLLVIGRIYGIMIKFLRYNIILLRPVDVVLRFFRIYGYGYSFVCSPDRKK